jgi:hypothetical protein
MPEDMVVLLAALRKHYGELINHDV